MGNFRSNAVAGKNAKAVGFHGVGDVWLSGLSRESSHVERDYRFAREHFSYR